MDFEKFEFQKVETMSGSEKGSTFVVIAKNKAVKLGIRVFLLPFPVKESMWVSLGFRLRAEGAGFDVNKETAAESFGNFPFYESKHHSSAVGVVPLVALPCSPAEVFTHYDSFKGILEVNIVNQIKEKLDKVGVKLLVDEALVIDSLRENIKDILPELKAVTNGTAKMLWVPADKHGK